MVLLFQESVAVDVIGLEVALSNISYLLALTRRHLQQNVQENQKRVFQSATSA
jgi:hypothetical protein